MTLGSFAQGALADLTAEDLGRMLELDETLFVEHKKDIGKEGAYKVIQAVAAFANTLGGWLLIGVHGGKPTNDDAAWADPAAPTLVDTIRDRLRGEIDPLPTFEAKVIELPDGRVGVVRVYESADTPHVLLRSGAVFVREVAGVADASGATKPGSGAHARRRYEATQIRSRAQLLELAERGRRAKERVAALVDPAQPLQLINEHLGLVFEQLGNRRVQPRTSDYGRIFVRLVPYTLLPRSVDGRRLLTRHLRCCLQSRPWPTAEAWTTAGRFRTPLGLRCAFRSRMVHGIPMELGRAECVGKSSG